LADRAAVRIENGGDFFAGALANGFVEVAGDGSSIFAFEVDIVDLGEAELGDEGVVGFGEASEIGSIRKEDFIGAIEGTNLRGDGAVFADE